MSHVLDNPIWSALNTAHHALAIRDGALLRYPREVAPFVAVPREGIDADAALHALVEPGETVYLVGPKPRTPEGWMLQGPIMLAQMVCGEALPLPDGPAILLLDHRHEDDVRALAALVYPHYFRARTIVLGRYFGSYLHGQLAAMVGERMACEDWREVSAVCTHPQHLGHGYARRLLIHLSNDLLAHGQRPFLHVSQQNERAKALYLRNGYRIRTELPHWVLRRP